MANFLTIKDITMRVGDTIAIHHAFKEGDKMKNQIFQGVLIAVKGSGNNVMFTVRKVGKDAIGVERIFPLISPLISKVEIIKKGSVRRSKLYFVRGRSEKELRDKLLFR